MLTEYYKTIFDLKNKNSIPYLIITTAITIVITLYWWYYTLPTEYTDDNNKVSKPPLGKVINRFFIFYSPVIACVGLTLLFSLLIVPAILHATKNNNNTILDKL